MRRFWLLLLALVMPLQMSWAAVHFCDDDMAAVISVAHAEGSASIVHDHAGKPSPSKAKDVPADACCGAAHGCHGLHNLMATAQPGLTAASSASPIPAHDSQRLQPQFAERLERPQWPAA